MIKSQGRVTVRASRRRFLLLCSVTLMPLLTSCLRRERPQSAPEVRVELVAPTADDAFPQPTPVPTLELLRGFIFPIAGACLPQSDTLMPNAPRPYRNGIHEGVDFYASDNCNKRITKGTEVLAAKGGRVIRADLDYHDLTAQQVNFYWGRSDEEALDAFRGRQVWIDHGSGIVTRYCHLSGIAPGIREGMTVEQGQIIAYVGESGTPESVTAPGTEYHLHFEVRVGPIFLGKGLPPDEVRALYERLFRP